MILLESPSTNAAFNLAMEQYIFDCLDNRQEYFMIWQNKNAVIIGKNQNTIKEINQSFIQKNDIQVIRRLSGGGAVYHDLGNINYTFIVNETDSRMNLKLFTKIVSDTLNKLGIHSEISGRNDILIDGKKFSGTAQYHKNHRVMHHGTLMFHSDLSVLANALNVSENKIQSKGIESVRSRVANICDYLSEPLTLGEFKQKFLDTLFEDIHTTSYDLTSNDIQNILKIKHNIYDTWQWNFGHSPDYMITRSHRFENCGEIELCINVEKGIITSFHTYGDYFSSKPQSELSSILEGCPYRTDKIQKALQNVNLNDYFSGLSTQQFVNYFFS